MKFSIDIVLSSLLNYLLYVLYKTYAGVCILTLNVTLSHLRSKEFQRVHKPCIPHHRIHLNVHHCTFRCILGKVVALQKSKSLSSKKAKP